MTVEQALLELAAREPIFHRPELGTDYGAMVTADFWEIGASGKIYTREAVLSVLRERLKNPGEDVWAASGFQCRKLSEEYFLLHYNLVQDQIRETRRSTLWHRTTAPAGWKIAFHQGTVVGLALV